MKIRVAGRSYKIWQKWVGSYPPSIPLPQLFLLKYQFLSSFKYYYITTRFLVRIQTLYDHGQNKLTFLLNLIFVVVDAIFHKTNISLHHRKTNIIWISESVLSSDLVRQVLDFDIKDNFIILNIDPEFSHLNKNIKFYYLIIGDYFDKIM